MGARIVLPKSPPSLPNSTLTSLPRRELRWHWPAKRATSTTPIVFATAGDPVGTGLVPSLAHPGGNVTGLSVQQIDLGSKRVELLRELVPDLRRLAVMANVGSPDAVRQLRDVETTVNALGLQFVQCELQRIEDVASVIDGLKGRAEALYVISDPLLFSHRDRVNVLAMSIRLPTIHSFRDHVETGGAHVLWAELSAPISACRRFR